MTLAPTSDDVVRRAAEFAFGRRLVTNDLRGLVVEAIVAELLGADWTWGGAWSSWDFQHTDGTRLEVKQSATRQTWSNDERTRRAAKFDTAARTGYFDGESGWQTGIGRHAHVYVFAHHPIEDQTADHRDTGQWRFYVAPTTLLPAVKQLTLKRLRLLCPVLRDFQLSAEVEKARLARVIPSGLEVIR